MRSIANARRITARDVAGRVSGSACLATLAIERTELKLYGTWAWLQRIALRHDQHRHAVGEGLRDAAEGVLRPRPLLHHEHAHPPALGQAAERVGHVQPGALLADDHRADVDPRRGLEHLVARIAEHDVDALALEHRGDRVGDGAVGVHRIARISIALPHRIPQEGARAG